MRRHPIFVLLGNATTRQLAIGACVALGIVGLYAGMRAYTEPEREPPSKWMTAGDESSLRSAMQQLQGEHPGAWVAGCAWQHDAESPSSVLEVPGDSENYRAETSSGRPLTFAVVTGAGQSASGQRTIGGPGYLCLVPNPASSK